MVNVIGMECMLHISFSLAALIFSVVLFVLSYFHGAGQSHSNLTFRTLTGIVVFGNLLSILDNIFRDAGVFPTPYPIQLFLLLAVYAANILLTYYMARYMEGFFGVFRLKGFFHAFHRILVISGLIITAVAYLVILLLYNGTDMTSQVPLWIRFLLGYIYELYFLVYTCILFIVYRKMLSRRARITSVSAYAVVIGAVLVETLNTIGVSGGILFNYFGAVLGLYIFYIGVETPDYRNLMRSMTDLEQARKQADEANRFKSDFLANMSHEIRTPINAILGMNEMILREAGDPDIVTYSENIESAGATLLGLINDILDFSKIEAGRVEIRPEDYDLAGLLSDLVAMIRTRADDKGLLLCTEFDREMPRQLFGDEVRVKQVIANLLTNAVKYTEKGRVTFSVRHEKIASEPDTVLLHVAIKDTGIGIKKEDLPKLFVEFERIEEKRNRHIEGTGLGMTITKRLLGLMDSTLEVESTYGKGSVFSFVLKQKVTSWKPLGDYAEAAQERLRDHERYHARFVAPDARVLVVDDNRMNLMVVKSLLKQTWIQVDTAEDGDEGLFLMKQHTYDVIFLDHMMPQKDGIEVLHELRSLENNANHEAPAICLTANAIAGAREQYLEEGFRDYLPKPINSGELEKLLLFYLPQEKITRTPPQDAGSEKKAESKKKAKTELIDEASKAAIAPEEVSDAENDITAELAVLTAYGVDVEAGIRNSDDPEVYIALLREFYDSLEDQAKNLDGFKAAQDLENYTILAHSMKSSLRLLGIEELGEEAFGLEMAGKNQDTGYIESHHDGFLQAFRGLKQPLAKVFYLLG